MADMNKLTRRGFLKGALASGGLIAAGGAGYRVVSNQRGRHYDVARSEALLNEIAPGPRAADVQTRPLPNIVLVVADDLGFGDLGCYGSMAIKSPYLDQMAQEGVLMTNFCSSAPLCSPSRAGLLTGRYPVRTHITMPLYPAGSLMDLAFNLVGAYAYGVRGIPEDEVLLSELLQRRGYRTALLGKWHLGDRSPHLPNENGFDLFYGAYYSNDERPYAIYRDEQVELPAPADQNTLTQRLTQEAIAFVRQNAQRPFFLYYAQPFPHIPLHASSAFCGRSRAGLYGDVVQEIDWSVGQTLNSLHELNLERDTLVLFTSDNGPWWQGSPGSTRGRKNLPFEGGFRVPLIARWPGVLPEGTINGEMASNLDLFATCLSVAGVPLPGDRVIDGVDLLPVLREEAPTPHEALYYYKGQRLLGVRQGKWKYLRRHMTDNGGYASLRQGPFLFNLEIDPNESYSLIGSEPDIARRLVQMLDDRDAQMERNPRGWQ
jgi:arylsulfatase A-like enzyme